MASNQGIQAGLPNGELSESGLDFYHKPVKTALRKLTKDLCLAVSSCDAKSGELRRITGRGRVSRNSSVEKSLHAR